MDCANMGFSRDPIESEGGDIGARLRGALQVTAPFQVSLPWTSFAKFLFRCPNHGHRAFIAPENVSMLLRLKWRAAQKERDQTI